MSAPSSSGRTPHDRDELEQRRPPASRSPSARRPRRTSRRSGRAGSSSRSWTTGGGDDLALAVAPHERRAPRRDGDQGQQGPDVDEVGQAAAERTRRQVGGEPGRRGDRDLRRDRALAAQHQHVAPPLQPQPGVVEAAVERVEHHRRHGRRRLGDEPLVDRALPAAAGVGALPLTGRPTCPSGPARLTGLPYWCDGCRDRAQVPGRRAAGAATCWATGWRCARATSPVRATSRPACASARTGPG